MNTKHSRDGILPVSLKGCQTICRNAQRNNEHEIAEKTEGFDDDGGCAATKQPKF